MFSTTKMRFSITSASLLLRMALRPTDVAKRRRVMSPTMPGDVLADTTSLRPHVDVFTSLEGSLDNILGGATGSKTEQRATHHEAGIPSRHFERVQTREELFTEEAPPAEEGVDGRAFLPSFYKPMNIRGTLYEEEMAERLRAAAASRRYRSPVWATRSAFARDGYTVGDAEAGVDIITTMQTVALYNLEQTNAPEAAISSSMRNRGPAPKVRPDVPLSAAGRPHTQRIQRTLREHPSYSQYTLPYWITEEEAVALGTAVRPEQKGCGILIVRQPSATAAAAFGEDGASYAASEIASQPPTDFFMLYNATQLENPENVTSETCPRVDCINVDGRRYGVLLTVYMRQYCQKHQFSTLPVATFITAARLSALGGYLRPLDRTVPPFTCIINDEVVSLYHAEHTTMSEKLVRQALDRRRERFDRVPSEVV